jgi:GTP-binding protein Era
VNLDTPPDGGYSITGGGFRSGFACFVGRPNTGKSTLTNALVGDKIAITSSRPQTTRHAIRGLVHRPDGQLVLIDTPGLHKPRTVLGERLNDLVRATWREVDTVGVCLPADERVGPGDRFLIGEIARLRRKPVLAIATKIDLVSKERLAEHLASIQKAGDDAGIVWQDVVPVSAVAGEQIKLLADLLLATLPEGPPLYPKGQLTDEPEETLIAEVIREAALEGVRDELPHSIAVTVDEVIPGKTVKVHASLFVERDSQKGIVIGHKGARLREIGTASRSQIERILGSPVFLDLHVKVAKDWQRDPKQLRKLGF